MISLVDFSLNHLDKRKGTWLSTLIFYMSLNSSCGAVEGSTLSLAACAVGHISVLCVDVPVGYTSSLTLCRTSKIAEE